MVRKPNPSSRTLIAAFVAAAFGVTGGAALAQTTTSAGSTAEAVANSPSASHVTLTDQQNEQSLHYSQARNLRICNLSGRTRSAAARLNSDAQTAPEERSNLATAAPVTSPTPVALQVSNANMNEQIQPGSCYDFRARTVRLSTAQRLPAGRALTVSIMPVSATAFVNGRTTAASSEDYSERGFSGKNADTRQSVKQLKEQLKQDDEQERQANAELSQARTKLAQTTRDLKRAEADERHVASAEHRTTTEEHRAQQNARQAQPDEGTPQ